MAAAGRLVEAATDAAAASASSSTVAASCCECLGEVRLWLVPGVDSAVAGALSPDWSSSCSCCSRRATNSAGEVDDILGCSDSHRLQRHHSTVDQWQSANQAALTHIENHPTSRTQRAVEGCGVHQKAASSQWHRYSSNQYHASGGSPGRHRATYSAVGLLLGRAVWADRSDCFFFRSRNRLNIVPY